MIDSLVFDTQTWAELHQAFLLLILLYFLYPVLSFAQKKLASSLYSLDHFPDTGSTKIRETIHTKKTRTRNHVLLPEQEEQLMSLFLNQTKRKREQTWHDMIARESWQSLSSLCICYILSLCSVPLDDHERILSLLAVYTETSLLSWWREGRRSTLSWLMINHLQRSVMSLSLPISIYWYHDKQCEEELNNNHEICVERTSDSCGEEGHALNGFKRANHGLIIKSRWCSLWWKRERESDRSSYPSSSG